MKLIIQIPCYNEETTLPLVFEKLPKHIDGIDVIEYQIINDGSTDDTVEVAKKLGVHHILTSSPVGKNRRWLGRAFKMGVENALQQGADILVNTDGDNQYPSEKIPELIKPILAGRAHLVVGDRKTNTIREFSWLKKRLQQLGSKTVTFFSGVEVKDAVSGFRAYSREAMLQINIVTHYTYTVDTIMQASKKGLDIEWIPINVNKKTRESRLIKNIWSKVARSGGAIVRMFTLYEPFKTFLAIASVLAIPGLLLIGRFLYFYSVGSSRSQGLVQSLLIGIGLVIVAVQILSTGVLADLVKTNRMLIEDVLANQKDDSQRKR